MGRVDEAVALQPELFGGDEGAEVRTLGTFANHAIILNNTGEFFRASFSFNEETGEVEFDNVERVDIPVREASELSAEVRNESVGAVKALLDGNDDEVDIHLGSLYELVRSGVKLTAEGVEDDFIQASFCGGDSAKDPEWLVAVRENEKTMAQYVGAEANKDFPKPKFDNFINEGDNSDDRHRKIIEASLRRLRESLHRMKDSIAVACRFNDEYRLESDLDSAVIVEDFIEFVSKFGADLDATIGIVEDAISVCKDGTLKSLARVHDGVAARAKEMGLAAAFSEKFARRFDQPQ